MLSIRIREGKNEVDLFKQDLLYIVIKIYFKISYREAGLRRVMDFVAQVSVMAYVPLVFFLLKEFFFFQEFKIRNLPFTVFGSLSTTFTLLQN